LPSIVSAGAPLALYWEAYGLQADSSGDARYTVRVSLDRQGLSVVASVARFLSGVLGAGRRSDPDVYWEVHRPAGDVLPEVLVLQELPSGEALRVTITVTETATGRRAVTQRVVGVAGR
jgi:hypothetical protein